jgi:hypothetical protein
MNWVPLIVVCGLTLTLGAILFQYNRRRKKDDLSQIYIDLRPAVRIASFKGWASLELRLVNRSSVTVWLEEAKLVITDLEANFQTALATGHTTHRIMQTVLPHEPLSMSLAGSLYEAAGRPQGPYSFLLLGTVHYRIGEDWAVANIRPHRIEMAALSVLRLRRIRQKSTTAEAHGNHEIASGSQTQGSPSKETAMVKSAGQ